MSRTDRRGNRKGGPAFTQLFHWLRATPAWRSLSPWTRLAYIELRAKYSGQNNGDISMSYRELAELLGCSNRPVLVAFEELQDRGFIVAIRKGAFDWKSASKALDAQRHGVSPNCRPTSPNDR